ncbi:MAG: hypothetical protein B7733_17585 [Myxococcales bacterium FL481]|nr:MAG: hypothetical protein B7733_17585 [Myxococcales bacterium FL481]
MSARPMRTRLQCFAGVVAAGLGLLAACKPTELYRPPPTLRGVTVPLPPPTYRNGERIEVSFEGNVPAVAAESRGFVYLWEDLGDEGRYVLPAAGTGAFVFEGVDVTVQQSCVSTYYELDDGSFSPASFYRLELANDPARCEDPDCTAPDEFGACVCLVEWGSGC